MALLGGILRTPGSETAGYAHLLHRHHSCGLLRAEPAALTNTTRLGRLGLDESWSDRDVLLG